MSEIFNISDPVYWTSKSGRDRMGEVVEIIEPGYVPNRDKYPEMYTGARKVGLKRLETSYVVNAPGGGAFWPPTNSLKLLIAQDGKTAEQVFQELQEAKRKEQASNVDSPEFVKDQPVKWSRVIGDKTSTKLCAVLAIIPPGEVPNQFAFPTLYKGTGIGKPRKEFSYVVQSGNEILWPFTRYLTAATPILPEESETSSKEAIEQPIADIENASVDTGLVTPRPVSESLGALEMCNQANAISKPTLIERVRGGHRLTEVSPEHDVLITKVAKAHADVSEIDINGAKDLEVKSQSKKRGAIVIDDIDRPSSANSFYDDSGNLITTAEWKQAIRAEEIDPPVGVVGLVEGKAITRSLTPLEAKRLEQIRKDVNIGPYDTSAEALLNRDLDDLLVLYDDISLKSVESLQKPNHVESRLGEVVKQLPVSVPSNKDELLRQLSNKDAEIGALKSECSSLQDRYLKLRSQIAGKSKQPSDTKPIEDQPVSDTNRQALDKELFIATVKLKEAGAEIKRLQSELTRRLEDRDKLSADLSKEQQAMRKVLSRLEGMKQTVGKESVSEIVRFVMDNVHMAFTQHTANDAQVEKMIADWNAKTENNDRELAATT